MTPTPCRHCGQALDAAIQALGICAWCLYASSQAPLTVPHPRYSADGDDDEPEGHEYDVHPE